MINRERRGPRITVQAPGAPDLVSGQVAWGALVGRSSVLVPPRAAAALQQREPTPLTAYLAPATLDADSVVESFPVDTIHLVRSVVRGGAPDPDLDVARLDLAGSSLFQPVAQGPVAELDGEEHYAGFADLWALGEETGMLPAGFREPPDPSWLDDLSELLTLRSPRVVTHVLSPLLFSEVRRLNAPLFCPMPWLC